MTRARGVSLGAAMLLTACATTPERRAEAEAAQAAELAEALDGYSPGAPQDCMPIDRTNGPQIIGGGVVLYRESGRRTWLARTEDECPWLRRDGILVTERFGNQMCRTDRFRLIDRGSSIPSGHCRFGSFTPYDKN
ncbi:DUF6491 family protein [Sphingomonas sp. AX6]|uniref:DUF6491 family protein n=1 Tax=Sphingomonas sp. AX6 TaxID=2653171 RepID=UPI00135BF6C4|nr:DUF6491 family protein [Sphingomonas sp. AX6]